MRPEQGPLPASLAGTLVFASSGAVLVVEIIAARLLAPYVGLDIETYTTIIGVVLAGISVGAWLGGRAADRVDPRLVLGPILLAGGLFAAATVPIIDAIGTAGDESPLALTAITVATFFLPAALLSAIAPLVVKLQLRALGDTGRIVGRYSAIGTAGALLGTFLTGFVLIPWAPTGELMVGLGAALVLAGALLSIRTGPRLVAALAVAFAAGSLVLAVESEPTCDMESAYSCARVVADPDRVGGRTLYLDDLRHSYVDVDDPGYLRFAYLRLFADLIDDRWPAGRPLDALHIGGAGFSFPRYLRAERPGSESAVLEIDPKLVDFAESELGLERGEDLEVRIGDARESLRDLQGAGYDLVAGDAFSGRSVPWQLTTREAIALIRGAVEDDGLYLMNMIDGEPWSLARAELATLRQSFDRVGAYLPTGTYGNVVLVASPESLPSPSPPAGWRHISGFELERFVGDAEPLRDEWAPVERLRGRRQ